MSRSATICPVCLVAFIVCTVSLYAQSAKMIRLPTGEYVYDLNGEWDAIIESYSREVEGVAFLNVVKITQIGNFCPVTGVTTYPITIRGILLKDNLSHMPAVAGSEIFRGKLEGNDFEKLEMISGDGEAFACKGQIGDNGNKIIIYSPNYARMTLTRK
jgi:hypothetical protein